jgi:bud emergence protein 1
MKGIRRSLNKERIGAPVPTYSSLPTDSFPSIQRPQAPISAQPPPPTRVIRATHSYTASPSSRELTFVEGDFFHVVSDEGDDDWFDAANPLTGARGLVPASHFQVLGRNARDKDSKQAKLNNINTTVNNNNNSSSSSPSGPMSGGSSSNGRNGSNYAAGYSSNNGQRPPSSSTRNYNGEASRSSTVATSPDAFFPNSSQPSLANRSNQPSPNQYSSSSLSQSQNSSQQKQQTTLASPAPPKSQPLYGIVQYDFVAERADELDAKRGEPIIVIAQSNHEWFVAKPIGRLGGPGLIPVAFVEIQDMTTGKPVENVEELIRSAVVPKVEEWKKMTADYKSASISLGRFDTTQPAVKDNERNINLSSANQSYPQHQQQQQEEQQQRRTSSQYSASNPQSAGFQSNYQQDQQDTYDNNNELVNNDSPNDRYSYSRERMRYGLVTAASVESFHQEDGSFWFHLRAFFSTGASLVLYRLYQDFYDFQIALMDEFPVEAGRVPPTNRILPMMPGPTDREDEGVCAQRVHDLSLYLNDLCALPDRIRMSGLMYEFLVPRAGDVEVAVGNGQGVIAGGEAGGNTSIEGQYGELVEYLDQMEGGGNRPLPGTGSQVDEQLAGEVANMRLEGNGRQNNNQSRNSNLRTSKTYSNSSQQYSPNGGSFAPYLLRSERMD